MHPTNASCIQDAVEMMHASACGYCILQMLDVDVGCICRMHPIEYILQMHHECILICILHLQMQMHICSCRCILHYASEGCICRSEYCIQHPSSIIHHLASSIQHPASSIQH